MQIMIYIYDEYLRLSDVEINGSNSANEYIKIVIDKIIDAIDEVKDEVKDEEGSSDLLTRLLTWLYTNKRNITIENIAKLKIPCWVGEKTVIATVIDKNGDTLILQQQPLNDLPKRTVFSRCPKYKDDPIAYRMGIFPVARREFYRKYWIKPSMLKPVETDIQ